MSVECTKCKANQKWCPGIEIGAKNLIKYEAHHSNLDLAGKGERLLIINTNLLTQIRIQIQIYKYTYKYKYNTNTNPRLTMAVYAWQGTVGLRVLIRERMP